MNEAVVQNLKKKKKRGPCRPLQRLSGGVGGLVGGLVGEGETGGSSSAAGLPHDTADLPSESGQEAEETCTIGALTVQG